MYTETWNSFSRLTSSSRVLRYIFRCQPISRSDIARDLGLSPAMVTSIITSLMEDGIVEDLGETQEKQNKTSGRKRLLLGIRKNAGHSVGVEVGVRHFRFCLTDLAGNILHQIGYVPSEEQIAHVNQAIVEGVEQLVAESGLSAEPIIGAGIALPGHLDPLDGHMITLSSLWSNFNVHRLAHDLSMEVTAENNVRSMAYQKYLFNYETCPEDFVFLHVGTGIFCASFTSGQLAEGSYISGEIGHTIANPDGPRCECGKNGCLQTYASEPWIMKKVRLLYEAAPHSILRGLADGPEDITPELVLTAFRLGDQVVIQILQDAIRYLGIAMANISILMNPKKLYLHSRMFQHPPLRSELQQQIESQLAFLDKRGTEEIKILDFDSSRAAVGAAALAIDRLFICGQP